MTRKLRVPERYAPARDAAAALRSLADQMERHSQWVAWNISVSYADEDEVLASLHARRTRELRRETGTAFHLVLLLVIVLAGCASPEERHAREVFARADEQLQRCYVDLAWRADAAIQRQCDRLATTRAGGPGCGTGQGFRCPADVGQVEAESKELTRLAHERGLGGEWRNSDP